MASETSQTLDRGLRVMEVLADAPDGLTVTELATALGVSRTVVYRLVVTLERHALVRRSADGRCRMGLAVLALARQVQPLLRDAAAAPLRRLADATAATAHLSILDGPDMLAVLVAEPVRSDVHVAYRVGTRTPADRSAAGRAVMAARASGGRPPDPAWVLVADGQQGARSVAAPIAGIAGIDAAVSVVTLADPAAADLGPKVARTAAEIARSLR